MATRSPYPGARTPAHRDRTTVVGEIVVPGDPPARPPASREPAWDGIGGLSISAKETTPRPSPFAVKARPLDGERDQRRDERLPLKCHVCFCVDRTRVASGGTLVDIAQGGAFVRSARPVRPAATIVGTIRTDVDGEAHPLRFYAEVAWSTRFNNPRAIKGPGFGLRFVLLERRDLRALEALIAARSTEQSLRSTEQSSRSTEQSLRSTEQS